MKFEEKIAALCMAGKHKQARNLCRQMTFKARSRRRNINLLTLIVLLTIAHTFMVIEGMPFGKWQMINLGFIFLVVFIFAFSINLPSTYRPSFGRHRPRSEKYISDYIHRIENDWELEKCFSTEAMAIGEETFGEEKDFA